MLCTVGPELVHPVKDKRALHIIVNGQLLIRKLRMPYPRRKPGLRAVKGECKQLTILCPVHRLKAKPLGKGLIRQPRLLLVSAKHTDSGFGL